jgi:hypothetical protein
LTLGPPSASFFKNEKKQASNTPSEEKTEISDENSDKKSMGLKPDRH